MMKTPAVIKSVAVGIGSLALAMGAVPVAAQTFPSKPIQIVVPFAPGGVVDVTARQLGQKLSEALGQSVLVDNKGGAGGSIAAEAVAKAAPDGHTLLMAFDTHAVNPHIYKNLRYDTFKDFAPVTMVGTIPLLLAAPPTLAADNLAGVIRLAKAKPGALSYGSVGAGSSGHLAMEQFKLLAGVDMLHVPFKGGAPAVTALMGNQVELLMFAAAAAVPLVQSGKVKAIAVSGTRRASVMPQVPTMAEAGFPQFNSGAWMGLLAPAGTPPAVIQRLNAEVAKALKDPELIKRLGAQAIELSHSTPDEFGAFVRSEHDKWGKLIKDAKLNIQQ